MDKQKTRRWGKVALQLMIAIIATVFVVQKIDLEAFLILLRKADPLWLIGSLVLFNASKILSAFRLNQFFRATGTTLSHKFNLKLYYLGMLYNQFLPGGIGGDGYKVYLLNKELKQPVKPLIAATLLDRISGVVALGFLALILGFLGMGQEVMGDLAFMLWLGLILIYPIYYFTVKSVFPKFKSVVNITSLYSLGVQLLQVICALFILRAIGVEQGFVDYLALFLITSVAAALPISLPGGIGIREAIFAIGYTYFAIAQTSAVALATLFFLVSLLSATVGLAFLGLKSEH